MHEILNARIKYAIERIGIVKIVHQGSLCKKLKKLEILKSELDQMRVDRKLLVRQLLKKQDEEVLSEGFIGYSSSKLIDQSFDRLQLLESLSDALLEL